MAQTLRARPKAPARGGKTLPGERHMWSAWLWIGPAVLIVAVFLFYPVLSTIWYSLFDANSVKFVGVANYRTIFTNSAMLEVLRNNLLWLVLATVGTVLFGLIIAVLADRVRIESIVKGAIFIPMAISFVGASVIWRFVYEYRPPGQSQIGLFNAIITGFGFQPQAWLTTPAINNIAVIVVYVWMWTGFCMVILSAALKSVPTEILEASRVDGANEFTIFWRVIVPMISPTIAVVATTMVINVLKIFDVIYVMTGGDFGTNVIAMAYYQALYTNFNNGLGDALAVILVLVIVPVMFINVRRFRIQEAQR